VFRVMMREDMEGEGRREMARFMDRTGGVGRGVGNGSGGNLPGIRRGL